jgi:hypothetical protein
LLKGIDFKTQLLRESLEGKGFVWDCVGLLALDRYLFEEALDTEGGVFSVRIKALGE